MFDIIQDILNELQSSESHEVANKQKLSNERIQAIVRRHNAGRDAERHFAKKQLLPYYLHVKLKDRALWEKWQISDDIEGQLLATLQVKPRRTSSGVATISVITKPATCAGTCIYCPNDIRMPKSYLHNEPACQRAERNYFDPYLQVIARARALYEMGHNIEKIELIVLGGTWCDYPIDYQVWFARELFRACNAIEQEISEIESCSSLEDRSINYLQVGSQSGSQTQSNNPSHNSSKDNVKARASFYQECGISNEDESLKVKSCDLQKLVDEGEITYNEALDTLYGASSAWRMASNMQRATFDELYEEQRKNRIAKNRVVGFVVETRPDTITPKRLSLLRNYGCTKVQMGIQSMDDHVLTINDRHISREQIEHALNLTRLFGFKLHTHFMVNLAGATPQSDKQDYYNFINNPATTPDEVKLYPCALVKGTKLRDLHEDGTWRPYTESELVDVLSWDVLNTPAYCRISRMIRDISSCDILVGNKKTNLRQMVDKHLQENSEGENDANNSTSKQDKAHQNIQEIRQREIKTLKYDADSLLLDDVEYETTVSTEHFLQWITPDNHIAGFLRLSLPKENAYEKLQQSFLEATKENKQVSINQSDVQSCIQSCNTALHKDCAMIREVHVYGRAANIGSSVDGAQHTGLGRALVSRAELIAKNAGYKNINVISSIGTQEYYKHLGFHDVGAYQQKSLD